MHFFSATWSLAAQHKTIVLAAFAAFALAVSAWLVLRRRYRLLAGLAVAAVLSVGLYGVNEFRQSYPHADIFSVARLRDSAAILLGTDIRLTKFQPRSTLVVERKAVTKAMFPAIDVHFHLESLPLEIGPERLVASMDATGVAKVINMGGDPAYFERFMTEYHDRYPDRFVMFMKPDFNLLAKPGGVAEIVKWIDYAAEKGALGIGELNKSFGTAFRNPEGNVIAVDDPMLDPIWEEAGRLGLPVLIHTGDPPAFYEPLDEFNERYEELAEFPQWGRSKSGISEHKELLASRERLVARHPGTIFIGAHIGSQEEDLTQAAAMLDRYPNYYVDLAARVAALGRQPYTARRFLSKYQARVLFATDAGYGLVSSGSGWTPERYFRGHFEFLETANEYIEYPGWPLSEGRWHVYGVDLPPEALEKIYAGNIERLLPTHEDVLARLAQGSR